MYVSYCHSCFEFVIFCKQAARAYDQVAFRIKGPGAVLNFPPSEAPLDGPPAATAPKAPVSGNKPIMISKGAQSQAGQTAENNKKPPFR